MKLFGIIAAGLIILFTTSCGGGNTETLKQYEGTIEAAGITSYQYGTHILRNESDWYALKSDTIDLTNYEGREVTISASVIEGYPVDGGPVYLNVQKIKD